MYKNKLWLVPTTKLVENLVAYNNIQLYDNVLYNKHSVHVHAMFHIILPHSGKLSLFCIPIIESFLRDSLKTRSTVGGTSEQSTKVYSAKFHFPTNSRKFSPSKDSRYTVIDFKLVTLTYYINFVRCGFMYMVYKC